MKQRYKDVDDQVFPLIAKEDEVIRKAEEVDPYTANISEYLTKFSSYPLYDDSDIVYYDEAVKGLEAQKEELKKAEHFIFMEYHAIEDAESWHGIQEILEEKVKEGVEVRVFYDDMGSIGFINTDFVKRLEAVGIACRVFNPFALGLNVFLNNRDHRKITVIDGKVGFTGGYNLANEYFGLTHPFGQWKDTGVKITGNAVKNLTAAFLEMWNAVNDKDKDDTDFSKYIFDIDYAQKEKGAFIQPYADTPLDNEQVGENVYISMAENAHDYAWFITPYLILTDEMIHAFGTGCEKRRGCESHYPGYSG